MTNGNAAGNEPLLSRVIKWVIPSTAAFLVIVGFVVSTAHFTFLGFDPGFLGATTYSGITGEFLRDIASVALDMPRGSGTLLMDWPRSAFLVACLLVLASLGRPSVRSFVLGRTGTCAFAPIVLLLLVVLTKFVLMDDPLMRIENVLVNISTPSQSDRVRTDSGLNIEQRLQPRENEGLVRRYSTARASDLWQDMKCSRLNQKPDCERSEAESFLGVRAEFLAHLLAAIVIAFIAGRIATHTTRPFVVVAAVLSALSCLTAPYAYGKLMRSTHYQFGVLLVDHSDDSDKATSAQTKSDKGKPQKGEIGSAKETGDAPARSEITAFVLLQDANFVFVLRDRDLGECGATEGQKVQRRVQAKLSQIANGQVLSIKEIRRQDVIRWKALVERPCPDAGKAN